MNRTVFFDYVRNAPFAGSLLQSQIDGMNAILDVWEKSGLPDIRWLAYMLATAFHETAKTMKPVRETLASSDKKAVAILDKAFAAGKLRWVKTPYWRFDADGKSWLGRGLVQITHKTNYATLGKLIGVDLISNPSRALELPIAVAIMFEGMTGGNSSKGDFTGKSLENYFNATVDDPVSARKIINGTDKAELIAGYHRNFLDAIKKAIETETQLGGVLPKGVAEDAAQADNVPVGKSKSVIAVVGTVAASGVIGQMGDVFEKGTNFFTAITNPYQFASLLLVIVALGVLIWLMATGRLQVLRGKAVK